MSLLKKIFVSLALCCLVLSCRPRASDLQSFSLGSKTNYAFACQGKNNKYLRMSISKDLVLKQVETNVSKFMSEGQDSFVLSEDLKFQPEGKSLLVYSLNNKNSFCSKLNIHIHARFIRHVPYPSLQDVSVDAFGCKPDPKDNVKKPYYSGFQCFIGYNGEQPELPRSVAENIGLTALANIYGKTNLVENISDYIVTPLDQTIVETDPEKEELFTKTKVESLAEIGHYGEYKQYGFYISAKSILSNDRVTRACIITAKPTKDGAYELISSSPDIEEGHYFHNSCQRL